MLRADILTVRSVLLRYGVLSQGWRSQGSDAEQTQSAHCGQRVSDRERGRRTVKLMVHEAQSTCNYNIIFLIIRLRGD